MKLTLSEIYAQYDALEKTIALIKEKEAEVKKFFEETKPSAIVFTGCGSSFSLSCTFRSIASMRTKTPVYAVASGDLWLNVERYRNLLENALVLSVSRSGRTSEVINAYNAVKGLDVGARFFSIICADGTPLDEISDYTLRMPWAFDNSVCQTRCVSNIFAMGSMVIGAVYGDPSIMKGMEAVAKVGPDYMKRIDPIAQELAAKDWDHVVVLADGEIDGLAEEGALAYKEISQLNSNYYHILDVRHGPMVKIGEKTLTIVCVKSPFCKYEEALVDDVISHKGITVCYSQLPAEKAGTINVALGQEVGFVAYGLGVVALCQLVSYYKSGFVGCDPDQPDGLDPWIKIG